MPIRSTPRKIVVNEDGSIFRIDIDVAPYIKRVPDDAPRCSSQTDECDLHEHPDVVECCVHETFRCNRCEKIHPWDFGAADEAPGLCDDCWAVYFGTSDHVAEPTGVEP